MLKAFSVYHTIEEVKKSLEKSIEIIIENVAIDEYELPELLKGEYEIQYDFAV